MKNKYLIIIFFSIIGLVIMTFALQDYFFISDNSIMKNQTFNGINVSVPSGSHFNINPNSNTYSGEGTEDTFWITPYINNANYSNINDFFSSYMRGKSNSEIQIKGLNDNAKAFDFKPNPGITIIFVFNDKKDNAVIIETSSDRNLAVEMANSVVFPDDY